MNNIYGINILHFPLFSKAFFLLKLSSHYRITQPLWGRSISLQWHISRDHHEITQIQAFWICVSFADSKFLNSVHSLTLWIFISLPFKSSYQLTYHVLPFFIAFFGHQYARDPKSTFTSRNHKLCQSVLTRCW